MQSIKTPRNLPQKRKAPTAAQSTRAGRWPPRDQRGVLGKVV